MDTPLLKLLIKVGLVLACCAVIFLYHFTRSISGVRRIQKAVLRGDVEMLQRLVEKNREMLLDDDAELLSHLVELAVMADCNPECLKLLLSLHSPESIQRHLRDKEEENLLCLAVSGASPVLLRLLLEAGMKPEAESESPWLLCCVLGQVEHARVLSEFRGDVMTAAQSEKSNGVQPIHAIVYGWYEHPEASRAMLEYLLERGVDVNTLTLSGNTALDLACDETHAGYQEHEELREILTRAGAVRGATLRCPKPLYTIRILCKEGKPELSAYVAALPEGVSITQHAAPWGGVSDLLAQYPDMNEEFRRDVESHTSWIEVRAQGKPGEFPPQVANRCYAVAYALAGHYTVVAVQFGQFFGKSFVNQEADQSDPFSMVALERVLSEDGCYIICTRGMQDYGLQEYELVIPQELCRKHSLHPLEPLSDALCQAFAGTTCLESGHTMTICDRFATVEWRQFLVSETVGYHIVVRGE